MKKERNFVFLFSDLDDSFDLNLRKMLTAMALIQNMKEVVM